MKHTVEQIVTLAGSTRKQFGDKWVPARPTDGAGLITKIKHAWLVITGKADIVIWPCNQ